MIDKNNKLIGNGKEVFTWDKSKYMGKCPPNQGNIDVLFKIAGEFNPTTRVARMIIMEPLAEGYADAELGLFNRDNMGRGGWSYPNTDYVEPCYVDGANAGLPEKLLLTRLWDSNRHFVFIDLSTVPTKIAGSIKTPIGDVDEYFLKYDFKSIEYEITVCNRVLSAATNECQRSK